MNNIRVGIGFDVHAFSPHRKLILGGVEIDYPLGLLGHSDADVLVHAIIDSLLGPASLGDIGTHFPDSDKQYKDIRSIILLKKSYDILSGHKVDIINIDCVVACEMPKIAAYIDDMKSNISGALGGLPKSRIGIKGKTTEKLGFTGRAEGIAVYAVSLINIDE
jgi:2-C-methyl-D-erythritol 2,4-cyclodiphosphate synthase